MKKDLENVLVEKYSKKIEKMNESQLLEEKKNLKKNMNAKVFAINADNVSVENLNIADNNEYKNKVYRVYKLKLFIEKVNEELKNRGFDCEESWNEINNHFKTKTFAKSYVELQVDKNVEFADRLSVDGIVIYKKFLKAFSFKIQNGKTVNESLNNIIEGMDDLDKDMIYNANLYTKNIIIAEKETIKSIIKERMINEKLEEFSKSL